MSGIAAITLTLCLAGPRSYSQTASITPRPPRHELHLSPAEYSIVHSAIASGVGKYGGDADFKLSLARESAPAVNGAAEQSVLVWTMTITQPRLIDVLHVWMAEKTTELIGVINVDQLDPETKLAVRAVQSVNLKLAQARANPIWDPVTLTGTIAENAASPGTFTLDTPDGVLAVTQTAKPGSAAAFAGMPVVVTGYIKSEGQIELTSVIERRVNTLELVVMSQCPFGSRAADAVVEHLKTLSASTPTPRLDVRYLFYRKEEPLPPVAGPVITLQPDAAAGAGTRPRPPGADTPATKVTWWSLHGEPEIAENLVQMIIRDRFSDRFWAYLQKRAHSQSEWKSLAAEAGLAPDQIEQIGTAMTLERDRLIAAEYEYVRNTLGVSDGSPTFVWESQIAADIKKVPALKTLDLNKGSCGGTH